MVLQLNSAASVPQILVLPLPGMRLINPLVRFLVTMGSSSLRCTRLRIRDLVVESMATQVAVNGGELWNLSPSLVSLPSSWISWGKLLSLCKEVKLAAEA